jgi:release factor glutamine methyltransferase
MMRVRLPEVPRFLLGDALALPNDCCPVVAACVASGTLLLEQAGIETARLDAECLVAAGLGCPRWHLILEPTRRLSPAEFSRILRLLQRRERREPLAYVLGVREFWSLPMAVSAGVLVPRPETETLVEAALAAWGEMKATSREVGPTIVELCTGSGAVAIALATELPAARVLATDVSWRALRVARANATRHGVAERIEFLRGDLWRAVNGQAPAGSVDLVVANPPYIRSPELATLMPEVQWEPRLALDGGADGLRVLREIVASSPDRIRPGGFLLLEVGTDQAEAVAALLAASGRFEPARLRLDLAGRPRVVVARRRGM